MHVIYWSAIEPRLHCNTYLWIIKCCIMKCFLGLWIKDAEGYYEHCRWCGEGGSLLGCDLCIESFCKKCILRNLGRGGLSEAENSTKWKCYCCAPEKIKKHTEFAEVQKKPEIIRYFRIFFWDYFLETTKSKSTAIGMATRKRTKSKRA